MSAPPSTPESPLVDSNALKLEISLPSPPPLAVGSPGGIHPPFFARFLVDVLGSKVDSLIDRAGDALETATSNAFVAGTNNGM